MAVQPQTPYKEYTANGSTNSFALEFDCDNQDHLIVLVDDIEPVVGAWSLIGGAVVFVTAPTNGKKITIQRNTPFRRDEDFQSYDNSFRPPGVNKGFDKIWLKLQELGVADWILSNRIEALKSYVNQQDGTLQENIEALKSYVNQQDGTLQENIDSLKNYVDDKDDELRNYLLNAIQEQGVALDQLEEYYSYLMQQLAQVAIDRGWAASFIVSADGSTQQEINDFGGAKWRPKPLGYDIGSTVKLENGNIVKSTDANNIVDPNTNMTDWVKAGNILNVRSIAELLAVSNPKGGDIIFVESYHFGLLKGGGFFQYDQTQSNKNDGGLVINGWVRFRNSPYIHPEWFGAKGDGISDDYDALVKCFTSIESRPQTIYDSNIKQWSAKSATFMLDSVVYRHTQPLMLPIMADVTSVGAINYFAYKDSPTYNSKPTFFYDGLDTEVAATYLPFYKNNGDGTWSLNTESDWIDNTGDGTLRSMSVGCNYRFNIITKRNTKIGFNAFGFESGVAELGIGTIGSYAADQTEASALQSQDYNYDDLSPRVGVYAKRAWNSKFVRPRIIAHKTGMYIGGATASLVIDTPYVNRQVDKATDAINLGVEFLPTGIVAEKSVTTAFVFESADVHLIDPVCEHWCAAYMISNSVVTIDKPHVEGSSLIMTHDFIVYNSKININDWSAIRTMNAREGTSIVYSCGMSFDRGDFFALRGAGYYADNSLFNLVDGVGYNSTTNWEFLSVENMPRDKLFGACWTTDLRYINKIEGLKDNAVTLYLNPSRLGPKGLGASFATASQSISDLNEAIRILGDMWSGSIEIRSNLTVSTPQTLVSNKDSIKVSIPSGVALTTSGASLSINGVTNMTVDGAGTLQISSPMFRPSGSGTFGIAIRGGLTISGVSALLQCNDFFGAKNIAIYSGDLSAFSGNYAFSTSGGGSVNLSVQATTRNLLNEISTRRVEVVGHSVAAYFKNNLPSISSSIASTLIAANTQINLGTLTLTGLSVGDTLLCAYSVSTLGIQLRAEVTSLNTVTVYAFNPTTAPITLPSGTVTARKIYFNS